MSVKVTYLKLVLHTLSFLMSYNSAGTSLGYSEIINYIVKSLKRDAFWLLFVLTSDFEIVLFIWYFLNWVPFIIHKDASIANVIFHNVLTLNSMQYIYQFILLSFCIIPDGFPGLPGGKRPPSYYLGKFLKILHFPRWFEQSTPGYWDRESLLLSKVTIRKP